MIEHCIEQNTEEWLALKIGKFSASSAHDLLMNKSTQGYKKLIYRIAYERKHGEISEDERFTGNKYTDRGHELEDIAIESFIDQYGRWVKRIGFVELDDWTGCSPDGYLGDNATLQVKCPLYTTQIDYLKTGKIPKNYYNQMQFELYVTGRKYGLFYSFHPKMKSLLIKTEIDTDVFAQIESRLSEAKAEVSEIMEII